MNKYVVMKISNFEVTNKKDKRQWEGIPEDFEMLIFGHTRCGKTNNLIHMIAKPIVYYGKIYSYTPNRHQDKIRALEEKFFSISKNVGYDITSIFTPDDIPKTCKYQTEVRKLVVLDDVMHCDKKRKKKFLITLFMVDIISFQQFILVNVILKLIKAFV